jgi:hypothetical protein
MSYVHFRCDCGEKFKTKKFFKLRQNGEFVCYKATCPGCGVRAESKNELPIQKGARNTYAPKRKNRDRPAVVPANLKKLLAEEERLKKERQDGTDEVERGATESDDS